MNRTIPRRVRPAGYFFLIMPKWRGKPGKSKNRNGKGKNRPHIPPKTLTLWGLSPTDACFTVQLLFKTFGQAKNTSATLHNDVKNLKRMSVGQLNPLAATKKAWLGVGRDLDDVNQDVYAGLDADIATSRNGTHSFVNLTHVKAATDHLTRLPEPNETIHAVISGRYPLWALVPATLELIRPATITTLELVTLSFGKDNGDEMLNLLDAGQIGKLVLICSHYFAATNKHIYEPVAKGLQDRGQRIRGLRTHAKILNMRISDGRAFNVRSSANMRSCKNIETYDYTNSPELVEFESAWITKLINAEAIRDRFN